MKAFDASEKKRIAETILMQLGGNRFIVMTGAKSFSIPSQYLGLSFRIPRSNGINIVEVELDTARDTYNVRFSYAHGSKVTVKNIASDVYFDQLQELFTENTKLYTSL